MYMQHLVRGLGAASTETGISGYSSEISAQLRASSVRRRCGGRLRVYVRRRITYSGVSLLVCLRLRVMAAHGRPQYYKVRHIECMLVLASCSFIHTFKWYFVLSITF